MNIIIAGKNSIAVDVLKYIIDLKVANVFVVLNRTENFTNGFQKSLGFYANMWSIPIINLEEAYQFNDAVFLSLEFDRIIKPILFKTNQLINIHFSKLPAYKGMFTSALPILNGEVESGVTLHLIDEGIDTGSIIEQKTFKLIPDETARSLYLKYIKHGTSLVISNLPNILQNKYNAYSQGFEGSTYYGKDTVDYANISINYKKTANQIDQQLRAFTFREYQLPKFNESEIGSWQITSHKSSGRLGSFKQLNEYQYLVSTVDFDIKISLDCYENLWKYCKENDKTSLKELLDARNTDLEVKTREGWTALIIAVYHGSLDCVALLLSKGADYNAQNYNGTSVLMYAKSNAIKTRNLDIIKLLIKHGADLTTKDIYGKSVIDWAKKEDVELYDFLKKKVND